MNIEKRKRVFKKIYKLVDSTVLFMDSGGYVLESSDSSKLGEVLVIPKFDKELEINVHKGWSYRKVLDKNGKDYVLALDNKKKETQMVMSLIAMIIEDEIDELTSEEIILEFIKGQLVEEVAIELLGSLIDEFNIKLIIGVLEYKSGLEEEIESILRNLLPEDYIISYDNNHFLLIFKNKVDSVLTTSIVSAISEELLMEPRLSIGSEVDGFMKLKESFNDAVLGLNISKIYKNSERIVFYKELALPMMIEKMDKEVISHLYKNISSNIHLVVDDQELIHTSHMFLENNLNVTDTAQKLFIHRNTLIYRLNKIQKLTGFDLKKFEDALNFYIGINMHTRLNF